MKSGRHACFARQYLVVQLNSVFVNFCDRHIANKIGAQARRMPGRPTGEFTLFDERNVSSALKGKVVQQIYP